MEKIKEIKVLLSVFLGFAIFCMVIAFAVPASWVSQFPYDPDGYAPSMAGALFLSSMAMILISINIWRVLNRKEMQEKP
ncbi:MAG TPA: hypothetical protein VKM55_00015 [Candidatus Lokiarchaeia archaeon]|nr:hypothetical protein [Candidatus Lokiarchaeia archaeon]